MQDVRTKILSESLDEVNDDVVSKFMLYSTLRHELSESEGDDK